MQSSNQALIIWIEFCMTYNVQRLNIVVLAHQNGDYTVRNS